jgi:hypothetical protein
LKLAGEFKRRENASLLFPYRKKGTALVHGLVMKSLRPTGNVIEGYVPSAMLQRSQSEE